MNAITNNTTHAEIDYATCAAKQIVDINDNVSQVLFDPLGQVIVSTLFGEQDGKAVGGMRLFPYNGQPAQYEWVKPVSEQAVLTNPKDYLSGAANFFYYDLDTWKKNNQPVSSINLVRNNDYHSPQKDQDPYCQILVSYSDGLGRTVEKKLKTDPDPSTPYKERWQVSGRTVYNNKGKPCEQYLPYFSDKPAYEDQTDVPGPPPTILIYDPLERLVKTIDPKKFFSKVEFTPWEEKRYDEDDTVKDSEYYKIFPEHYETFIAKYKAFMEHYPKDPTKRQKKEKDALDDEKIALDGEKYALAETEKFYNTPEIQVLDSLGHRFLEIQYKEVGKELVSYYQTDILGRVTEAIDPRLYAEGKGLYNFKYRYAMGEKDPTLTDSVDAGVETHLGDIYGNQLWSLSPRDYCQLITYDPLRRRSSVQVKKVAASGAVMFMDFKKVESYTYGEEQPNPQKNNLCGQLYQLKDLSGIAKHTAYDLRGELLSSSRQMVEGYKTQINWNDTVKLEQKVYSSSFTYDALKHLLTKTTPDGSTTKNTYNQAGLFYAVQVTFKDKSSQSIVDYIEYDAKDQRTKIKYGNGVITKYGYEATTLRLLKLLSVGPNKSPVQDICYAYDPVGNVMRVRDSSYKTVFNNNQKVSPVNEYTYDALYRLKQANGRQHPGITANTYKNNPPNDFMQSKFSQLPPSSDGEALEKYTEIYTYDDSGNLTKKQHLAASSTWSKDTKVEDKCNRLQGIEYDPAGNMKRLEINNSVKLTFNCCENLVGAGIIMRPPDVPQDRDYYLYDSAEQRTRKVSERMAGSGAVALIEEKTYLGNYEIKRNKKINASSSETITLERQTLRVMDDKNCVAIVNTIAIDTKHPKKENTRQYRFQMANQQDSVALEMDEEAKLISYEEYFPYGGTAIIAGKNKAEVKLKEYRYSGKERDDSSGLYYYGARYYAPWLGRWLNPDPAGTVDGMNLYAFVGGNPVTHVDVGGMTATEKRNDSTDQNLTRIQTGAGIVGGAFSLIAVADEHNFSRMRRDLRRIFPNSPQTLDLRLFSSKVVVVAAGISFAANFAQTSRNTNLTNTKGRNVEAYVNATLNHFEPSSMAVVDWMLGTRFSNYMGGDEEKPFVNNLLHSIATKVATGVSDPINEFNRVGRRSSNQFTPNFLQQQMEHSQMERSQMERSQCLREIENNRNRMLRARGVNGNFLYYFDSLRSRPVVRPRGRVEAESKYPLW